VLTLLVGPVLRRLALPVAETWGLLGLQSAGVAPAPLISEIGPAVDRGRLIVAAALQARDHPHVFALGDAAAVPDLTRPGHLAAQTAQHAQRQGVTAARNVAASLANRETRPYRHKDLGFTVDLTGRNAVATVGLRLRGILAKIAGRAYHVWHSRRDVCAFSPTGSTG
jgi:NADH dehydrogenase